MVLHPQAGEAWGWAGPASSLRDRRVWEGDGEAWRQGLGAELHQAQEIQTSLCESQEGRHQGQARTSVGL